MATNGWGDWLREVRERVSLSQEDAAERMGISPSALSNYEREKVKPGLDFINAATALYPISAEQLLTRLGVRLSAPSAGNLPRPLINKLLALSPERLHALAELLPDPER